jgi:hypothetical protein
MNAGDVTKHYRDVAFLENRKRLKLLTEFRDLVKKYFDNSTLNMVTGKYNENREAMEAQKEINLIMKKSYQIIRLADIKTSLVSSSSHAVAGQGKNLDLILNIFNLARNDVPLTIATDYIESAIDIYKSNRLRSFMRTINPLFWVSVLVKYR